MRFLKAAIRSRKLRWFAVCLLLVTGGVAWWWFTRNPLDDFVDRDLRNLADTSKANWRNYLGRFVPDEFLNPKVRLVKWIDRTLPEKYTSKGVGFQPWYIWRFNDHADPRFLLLMVQQRGVMPGETRVALHFLSSTGKPISCSDLDMASFGVEDAAFRWESIVNERVLEIRIPGFLEDRLSTINLRAPAVAREPIRIYYSISSEQIALIHLEGNGAWTDLFAPIPPHRTAEECLSQLDSDRPAVVLEALRAMSRFDRGLVLVEDLRYDPALREKATEFSRSSNPWIRRAAQGALSVINH